MSLILTTFCARPGTRYNRALINKLWIINHILILLETILLYQWKAICWFSNGPSACCISWNFGVSFYLLTLLKHVLSVLHNEVLLLLCHATVVCLRPVSILAMIGHLLRHSAVVLTTIRQIIQINLINISLALMLWMLSRFSCRMMLAL